jgi:hypothetical protein
MFHKIHNALANVFTGIINKLFPKKWTLYLYYNGVLIKKKKIENIDDITVMSVNIWGHKELFGRSKINVVIRPIKLLMTDEKKKKTYWGVVFEKGIDINGR